MEKVPEIKFVPFERFAIKTEGKENPMQMPYLSYSLAYPDEEGKKEINNIIKGDLERLFRESSMDKTIVKTETMRQFFKTTW